MIPRVTLRAALNDPQLLGSMLAGDSWRPHRILLIAAFGEALTPDERITYKHFTGREREPGHLVSEMCFVAGRRTGKTQGLMATTACYLAGLCDHRDVLARGEIGVMLALAQDQKIAGIILDACEAAFDASPILRQLVMQRTQDAIELNNNIRIEVRPASFKKLRGITCIGICADELGYWYTDDYYQNPDVEVLAACRPALLTTHGPLIMASSPYAKRGILWDVFRKHYGPSGSPSVLVARGTTRDFNCTIPQAEIDRELERDPVRNTSEYLAEFRGDLESYVPLEVVEACIGGYREIAPVRHKFSYRCFVDAAGGTGLDSFAAAIAHRDGEQIIIDAIREYRPPFSPTEVIADICKLAKSYAIHKVVGDKFAGGFPPELFSKNNIQYESADRPKAALFRDFLPMLTSRRVVLPRHDRLVAQLVALEVHTARSGNDNISHPPNGHDDVANCVSGASVLAFTTNSYNLDGFQPDASDATERPSFAVQQFRDFIQFGRTLW